MNRDYKYKKLTVFDNTEKHPPAFLRVLMEAIHKGKKLSPACQQVVDMNKDKINFEPCWRPQKTSAGSGNASVGGATGTGSSSGER